MLNYISTRGEAPTLSFEEVMLTGLAKDGGLYVPETWAHFSTDQLEEMKDLSYPEIAFRVIWPFVEGCIEEEELANILNETYGTFHHEDIIPLHKLEDGFWVMELFHGPTLAFKDVALQFLGRMFDYALKKRGERLTIVGATSGDTGSAAIEACRDRDCLDIFILHPEGRVSEVQRRQMTSVLASNVYNIAVEGRFDDCQDMVKAMFNDLALREELNLSAINSINWARIVAQVAYYVYAAVKLGPVSVSVPTGNFGNVYAGYVAKKIGAPIEHLIVATNSNDILHRFFDTGEMKQEDVVATISPSMDIQISSNFERLLFELFDRNALAVKDAMRHFREQGVIALDENMMEEVREVFSSARLDDTQTKQVIRDVYQKQQYLLDPHSAVGVGAAQQLGIKPIVTLATADPSKFPDAVEEASGKHPDLPEHLADLFEREEKYETLPHNIDQVRDFIKSHVG